MKVTLIRPPAYSVGIMGAQTVPVLGVVYIAAAIRQAGHAVDIVDMCGEDIAATQVVHEKYVQYGMPLEKLQDRLRYSDVIGVSSMFSQDWPFHRELIRHVRRLYTQVTIIAGGEHISAIPEYCLDNCPELDICICGEGEHIFVDLISVVEKKSSLSDVPGIVYRSSKDQKIYKTDRAGRIKDIDSIPKPAWDLIPLENYLSRGMNYHIKRGRTMPMLATRGCPYKCSFCSNQEMWGSSWITRTPRMVVDEMEEYIEKYKARNFVFSDLTAVVSKHCITKLCEEIIDRDLDITFQLPTLRAEALDLPLLEFMYKAGCRDLDFAIESGSKKVLDSVNKKNDPRHIFKCIKDALKVGMNLSTNIVIGLPSEGWADYFKTYKLVLRLALAGLQELNVFPFIPYPGSVLFKGYLEQGRISLSDKYFLSLFGYGNLGQAVSWSDKFGPRTLSGLRFILLSHFYGLMFLSHPVRLWRMLKNIRGGKITTKLEGVLGRVFKNMRISSHRKKRYAK